MEKVRTKIHAENYELEAKKSAIVEARERLEKEADRFEVQAEEFRAKMQALEDGFAKRDRDQQREIHEKLVDVMTEKEQLEICVTKCFNKIMIVLVFRVEFEETLILRCFGSFFVFLGSFWVIWGAFLVILGHFGSFYVILGHLRAIFGHFRSLFVILSFSGHSWSFQQISPNFHHFCVFFKLFCLSVYPPAKNAWPGTSNDYH